MSKPMKKDEFEALMTKDRTAINRRLDELLPGEDEPPRSLHSAMRYSVLGGGKRLRGILCLAAHRIFGDKYRKGCLDAACALEFLHAYTLIHDDLPALDDDRLRRGLPCCHIKFGEATAILAGDALQSQAFDTLSRCRAPDANVLESVRILSRAVGSLYLVGGQAADLEGEGREPTPERVSFIHERKTAELIAASLSIGAVLAGAGRPGLDEIHRIGRNAGFAFQITDDLLDVEGSEGAVGKGLRKDSKKGKITHPACFGTVRSRKIAGELIVEAKEAIAVLGDEGYIQHLFSLIVDRVS